MNEPRNTYIRGYFIPKYNIETSKFEKLRDITENINLLEKYLNLLKETFKFFFKEKINNEISLKVLNDLYVLLTYGSISLPWKEMVFKWLKKFEDKIDILDFIESEFKKFSEITRKFYDTFPADDRPGFNTSSLLVHSITTSALASCIFINNKKIEKFSPLEIECIRTSSFFHDIGKPMSKKNHVGNSVNLFKEYFTDILSEDILNIIINTIKSHHKENPSGITRYVRWGDVLSSASDRLTNFTLKILSDKLNGIKENFNNKEFWIQNENKIPELTKLYLKNYEKELLQKDSIDIEFQKEGEIALIRGDVRHIHDYIDHVKTLAELRNSSSLLDYTLTIYLIEKLLEKKELEINPENILYSSGGNILLLAPGTNSKEILEFLEKTFYEAMVEGLEMTVDFIYLDRTYKGSFGDLYSKLAIKIGAKKNELMHKRKSSVLFGSAKLCESCGKNFASIPITFESEEESEIMYYCNSCHYKYDLKNHEDPNIQKQSIQLFWEMNIKKEHKDILQKWIWKDISPLIMEFISGISLEKIKNKKENPMKTLPPNKLAVINSDGNLIGEFIAKSVSLSDLYSRIIHISNTMIEIFSEIEDKLREISKDEDIIRLKIGKIYIGGDDILILVPGYLSIPIALTLTKEFYKKMGKQCTLSTGIFLCPPKFPIWPAIDTAKKLLDDRAKSKGRIEEDNKIGAIDFQSNLFGIHLLTNKDLKSLSNKPFRINKDELKIDEIHNLLNNIVDPNHQLNMDLEENYDNLYNFIYKEKELNYKSGSVLRDLRNKAKRIQSFFSLTPENLVEERQKAISYVLYKTVRQKEKLGRQTYIKLFNLIGDHNLNKPTLLFDSIELIRFLSGGIL